MTGSDWLQIGNQIKKYGLENAVLETVDTKGSNLKYYEFVQFQLINSPEVYITFRRYKHQHDKFVLVEVWWIDDDYIESCLTLSKKDKEKIKKLYPVIYENLSCLCGD